jgi:hypothetical protein
VEGKKGNGNFDLADAHPSLFPDRLGAPWLEIYNMEKCMQKEMYKQFISVAAANSLKKQSFSDMCWSFK